MHCVFAKWALGSAIFTQAPRRFPLLAHSPARAAHTWQLETQAEWDTTADSRGVDLQRLVQRFFISAIIPTKEADIMASRPHSRRTVIIVTAANEAQAVAYRGELEQRRSQFPPDTVLLAVSDPRGSRIGSGGGTLNALVAAHDELGEDDWLQSTLLVVIHSGGDSQRSPSQSVCGKAWLQLPTAALDSPFDLLVHQLLKLCGPTQPGLASFFTWRC